METDSRHIVVFVFKDFGLVGETNGGKRAASIYLNMFASRKIQIGYAFFRAKFWHISHNDGVFRLYLLKQHHHLRFMAILVCPAKSFRNDR